MANERKIKRRIKSAQNIAQITRAMEMVAASRLKRAQGKALAQKPYAEKILSLVRQTRTKVDEGPTSPTGGLHPLLRREPKGGKNLVILIATNKGLCGSLNADLFRKTQEWLGELSSPQDKENLVFVTLGTKASRFAAREGNALVADFSAGDFTQAVPALTQLTKEGFSDGTYDRVWIVYTDFEGVLKKNPILLPLLPFEEGEVAEEKPESEILVEPSYDAVLETLLPHVIEVQIRKAVLEAEASEHAARMLAMKNATDNAQGVIEGLTLTYNKVRQETITEEIADLVNARLAIE